MISGKLVVVNSTNRRQLDSNKSGNIASPSAEPANKIIPTHENMRIFKNISIQISATAPRMCL